ncbi:MAG: DNA alkylation repair protein, partial [Bacteroidota bacterium]
MEKVTRKSEINVYLDNCINAYHSKGISACVKALEHHILSKKVKFPLLEFCGTSLFQKVATDEHIELCDNIEALKTEGGNVILGIMLQHSLSENF